MSSAVYTRVERQENDGRVIRNLYARDYKVIECEGDLYLEQFYQDGSKKLAATRVQGCIAHVRRQKNVCISCLKRLDPGARASKFGLCVSCVCSVLLKISVRGTTFWYAYCYDCKRFLPVLSWCERKDDPARCRRGCCTEDAKRSRKRKGGDRRGRIKRTKTRGRR